jgi:ATP-dependent DNA helicase RecG
MPKTEDQNIEFKQQWRDEALKTISAFANTEGGTMYIGVDDRGVSVELKNVNKLLVDIPNKIRDMLGVIANIKTVKRKSQAVVKITVPKYTAQISYKGKFYKRSGSTTSELNGMALSRFLISRSGTSWDSTIEPRSSLKDINVKTIRHFQELAKTRFPFITREKDIKLILQKLNLAEKGKLKRAAILLFGKNPKKYFTSAFVQVGRFISESDVISTDVIEGNLFEQVEKTIEILRLKYLENRFYYEGIYRKEDLIYPEDALREAVINAVIHRDYIGPHTQLRVYDNELWLWNIGKLSDEITFDKLKKPHSSYPRNELLADIFFKAGFIEAWGRGTLKIISKCREKNLPEPEFSGMGGGFKVAFKKGSVGGKDTEEVGKTTLKIIEQVRRKFGERFGESSEKILEIILANKNISAQKIAKQLNISSRAVEKQIAKLKKYGILKRIGPAKSGHWKVIQE